MKVEKTHLPQSIIELKIEESKENVAKFRTKVLADLRKNADIKGFRKGANIPDDIIVRQFGEERILQMTIERAIDGVYRDTLRKEKLMPVSQAEIQEVISQDPLIVKIQVEVFPQIEIKEDYKKIKLNKGEITVSPEEVQAALDDIQTRFTHFHDTTDVGYVSQMGDRVTLDTDGYEDGKVLEATSMRDYPLVLGSNLLVPGFEEDIAGMKQDEEKEIDVTFPADYHNVDFAGKKTKFKVTIKKIEKAHKPEFTPEFIKDLRGKDLDVEGFKKLIQSELHDTKESNDQMQRELTLIEALVPLTNLDIGTKLLAQQTEQVFGEIKENITKDGIKVEDYIASLGLTTEQYKKQHVEPTALKRLQGELILSKLIELEKVDVSDEEMNQEVESVMSRFQAEDVLKRLKELYVPGSQYYEELRRRTAMRRLIDSFFTEAKK